MVRELATPPPWVCVERFHDIDLQAAQYRGYGQEYQQLSPGAFQGRVTSFDFGGDLVLQVETANQELAQAAATPADRWGICVLTETSPPCTLNGTILERQHVAVCPGGSALIGKTPAGLSICCVDLARDLLLEESGGWSDAGIIRDARGAQTLRETLESGVSTLGQLQAVGPYSAAVKSFKSSVADAIWRIISQVAADATEAVPRCGRRRALQLFRIAQEYIEEGLADGIAIAEICTQTGASRRSLEGIFQSFVGMGPSAYIRNLQLNRVRRDLMSGDRATASIGDIAARYGIWHWSRFSQNYRSLFGELPSQTRARRVSCEAGFEPAQGSAD